MPLDSSPPPRFDRTRFSSRDRFTCIGTGSLGAKARSLRAVARIVENDVGSAFAPAIRVEIPLSVVVATGFFENFLRSNRLLDYLAASPLTDRQIGEAFSLARLPAGLTADLKAFLAQVNVPLAVRSSSVLEDSMSEPFAGVYRTIMAANSHADLDVRLSELSGAIKQVYASTFFKRARDYRRVAGRADGDEMMAVIVQELVGSMRRSRFYPEISGVARSYNFYPIGLATPADGVVDLALGFGRAIVEDGVSWAYSPSCPHANPPYNTPRDLLEQTQKEFWALDLSLPTGGHDAGSDALRKHTLADAERDGSLSFLASTYLPDDDRIVPGTGRPGPRLVDFAPILKAGQLPLNALVTELLAECRKAIGSAVELEFAAACPDAGKPYARFGFLQVRPMAGAYPEVEVRLDEIPRDRLLLASDCALGNGHVETIRDIVYVRPQAYDARRGHAIARALEEMNRSLAGAGRPYVLIGLGRWGTSDPSAGTPVEFAQVSGARVIVEASSPGMNVMFSQGMHFFHNITSFRVIYLCVSHSSGRGVDWDWLEAQNVEHGTDLVRHVRLASPLDVRVDGRAGVGVIARPR